ncbi:MAG: hypothetical protein CMJ47_03890 [Planctomyces sp.]|nr:hypothetical protein [Planctomyces sp.]
MLRSAWLCLAAMSFAVVFHGCSSSIGGTPARPELSEQDEDLNFKMVVLRFSMEGTLDGTYLPTAIPDAKGKPLLSWRVALLEKLDGCQELYKKFRLNESWDSPHNLALIEEIPDIYRYAGDKASGKTTIQLLRGPGTCYESPHGKSAAKLADVRNKNDIIVLVRTATDKAVTWTQPEDFQYEENNPTSGLYKTSGGEIVFGTLGGLDFKMAPENMKLPEGFHF